jgi:AraC-like DNA-binding protein
VFLFMVEKVQLPLDSIPRQYGGDHFNPIRGIGHSSIGHTMTTNVVLQETIEEQALRAEWLANVTESCEQVCSQLAACDRAEADSLLRSLSEALPLPGSRAEWLVLRGLLLGVAVRASATLHSRLHSNAQQRCSLSSERPLDELASGPAEAAIIAFGSWQRTFLGGLNLAHPPTLGSSIGVLVRRDFRRPWSLSTLARHFRASPSQIRKAFGRKFGRSVHEYQQMARIVAAMDEVRSGKIDAIALSVGYQSKKNFYSAFRRLIGKTPTEYRRLSHEEASRLKARIDEQLTRPHPEHVPDSSISPSSR